MSDPLSSSEWAQRGFCGECGTSLFYFLKPTKMYAMAVGAFDDQEAFQLVREIFIDRKPSGFAFAGGNRVRHNLHNFRVSCASCV